MISARTHIRLAVPGLLGPFPRAAGTGREWPRLPNLETLLSRGESLPPAGGLDGLLFNLFGYPDPGDADLSSAAISRLADGYAPDDAFWMRAAPVFLKPDRDRVLLFDSEQLQLTLEEATALAAGVEEFYAQEGWEIQVAAPERWYLRLAETPDVQTTPLDDVVGRNMEPFLPSGRDARAWRARLNEVQMLLHTHPVNERREGDDKPPINGLWFWGGGSLPEPATARFSAVYAQDCLSVGLARRSGVPVRPLPGGFEGLRSEGEHGGPLVVLDRLQRSVLDADVVSWEARLRDLEDEWFAPLRQAIRRGRVASVVLYPGEGPGFYCDKRGMSRFWRRVRALENFFLETPGSR